MKHRITAALERFSRAMLAPLSYLSAAGLLLVVGALLTSAPLAGVLPFLRWEPVQLAGRIIYKCLTAVISNLSVLFCTGLAAALAKREKHQAAFIALMSYLVYLTAGNVTLTELGLLAQPDALTGLYSAGQTMVLGIQTVDTGVFGGILLGLLTAFVYDRTCEKAHRGILGGVFSGVRWSFACVAALAAVLGCGACFVWPPIQKAIAAVTGFIAASGNIGLFLYGFLERLLIPTGLHHLVYMPFQFSQLGGQLMVGSVTYTGAYVVMMTEYNLGLPFSDGIVWMYTGFTKTFGYFGIAAAFIFCARRGSRKKTAFQLLPLAFTASLASITEPLDFLFCFSAPVLWLAHAAISGSFIVLLHLCGVTAFTSNLLGSLVMNLSAGAARTNYPVLYLLGLAQIAVYFVVFTVLIKALDLPTPGRRPEEPSRPEKALPLDEQGIEKLIAAFGGRATIIGKKRLPAQSERIFCVPPIYSRCATAISRQQQHAGCLYDLSREKVTPKRPQSFRSYKFKNNISADIAKANASAILNRPAVERIHMQEQAVFTQKTEPVPPTGRFAPSPSGRLHLGNLACSLLAWLSAKSQGGRIVLRIEDLDAERCPRIYADLLEQDLDWLGLAWDEGGSTGGPNGPYYQSECAEIYTASYKKLEERGLVYPCFCSRAQLHAASAPHTSDGNVVYPGTCRGLTAAEIEEKRKKKAPAYRLMVPDEDITFVDGCMGPHTENLLHDCGDFYLRRADGVFAYQLAVVVDDARMGVTEVVRGADLLSSTARQLYLYRLLGLQAPGFAHCPLLLAPDGRRLSKRDGDQSLENLREKYTAQEIVGKLAYAYGLQPEPAPRTPESLIKDFSWAKVPKQDVCLPEDLF